jgi:hypothetical protein
MGYGATGSSKHNLLEGVSEKRLQGTPIHRAQPVSRLTGSAYQRRIKAKYKLVSPDGSIYLSRTPGVLGGHRKNKIYGALDCSGALSWIRKGHYVTQRVFFALESDAVRAGYRPCFRCLRADYDEWKRDPIAYKAERVNHT